MGNGAPRTRQAAGAPDAPVLDLPTPGDSPMARFLTEVVVFLDSAGDVREALGPQAGILGRHDLTNPGALLDYTHPDDIPKAFDTLDRVRTRPGFEGGIRCRARHIDGTWRVIEIWVANHLEDPAVEAIVVRARDATFDVPAAPELFGSLTDAVPIPVVVADKRGRLMYGNAAARELMGVDFASVQATHWADTVDPDDREELLEKIGNLRKPGDETSALFRVTIPDRGVRFIRARVRRASREGPAGWVATLADDTDQLLAEGELRRRATQDPLTGLPNRQAMLERLHGELTREDRGDGVGVIFIDLNGFKQVNDEHGHLTGDEVLVAVGQRLASALRSGDMVARVGGDEFVAVCSNCGPASARATARRLASAVGSASVDHPHLRASVGVATAPPAPADATMLLELADRDMYERRGRRLPISEPVAGG